MRRVCGTARQPLATDFPVRTRSFGPLRHDGAVSILAELEPTLTRTEGSMSEAAATDERLAAALGRRFAEVNAGGEDQFGYHAPPWQPSTPCAARQSRRS